MDGEAYLPAIVGDEQDPLFGGGLAGTASRYYPALHKQDVVVPNRSGWNYTGLYDIVFTVAFMTLLAKHALRRGVHIHV